METYIKDKTLVVNYESLDEMINREASDINQQIKKTLNWEKTKSSKSWMGVKGGTDEIDKIYNDGWTEGWTEASTIYDKLTYSLNSPVQQKKRRVFKDNGDSIDMQRVYSGALDTAWITSQKMPVQGNPVIKITTSIGANCNRSADEIFYKGVCAIILTDILEEQGYRVEIEGYHHVDRAFVKNSKVKNFYTILNLKNSNEPLDKLKLITVTAFAGFFRYYMFRSQISFKYLSDDCLGRCIEYPFETPDENTIVLNNVYSEREAIETIQRVLTKYSE